MAPRSLYYKEFNKRIRRTLNYGDQRILSLTLPLSEMVVEYFYNHNYYSHLPLDFAVSLSRESCLEPCTMIVSMIYLERIRSLQPAYFKSTSPAELYLSCLIIANKYLQDSACIEHIYNCEWANLVDKDVKDINKLEINLLQKLDWNIFVSIDEFHKTMELIEEWIARYNVKHNKFATYTDLTVLSNRLNGYLDNFREFLKYMSFFTTAYVASVIVITTSTTFWGNFIDDINYGSLKQFNNSTTEIQSSSSSDGVIGNLNIDNINKTNEDDFEMFLKDNFKNIYEKQLNVYYNNDNNIKNGLEIYNDNVEGMISETNNMTSYNENICRNVVHKSFSNIYTNHHSFECQVG
uniref:Protein CNPPD1 n=1 Tax=Parastrongyloides trichosuri TaxID=131310 RepID=A0A0N4ZQ91_PARTI